MKVLKPNLQPVSLISRKRESQKKKNSVIRACAARRRGEAYAEGARILEKARKKLSKHKEHVVQTGKNFNT